MYIPIRWYHVTPPFFSLAHLPFSLCNIVNQNIMYVHVPLMHFSIYNILSWEILYSVYTLYIHCTFTVHTLYIVHARARKIKAKFLPSKLRCHSYFNVCTCALVQSKRLNVWHVLEI